MNMQSNRSCEIVVSLNNDLAFIKETVASMFDGGFPRENHVTFLGVNCDSAVVSYISTVADSIPEVDVQFIDGALVRAVNGILQDSEAEYTCFLSANVILPENWLASLLKALECNTNASATMPICNGVNSTSIALPAGCTINTMEWFFRSRTASVGPDLNMDASACVLLKNSCIRQVGLLDEHYQTLKWALLDFSICRSGTVPQVCLAEDTFVYQFPEKQTVELEADQVRFNSKPRSKQKLRATERHNRKEMSLVLSEVASDSRWSPLTTARETYRKMRTHYNHSEYLLMAQAALKGLLQFPGGSTPVVSKRFTSRMVRPNRLRVTYVLHNLTVAGGVISTIQLANELVLLGAEVRVVALYQYPETTDWKWYTQPIVYRNPDELIKNFPESDIAIATHWTTANWVAEVVRQGGAGKSVYFLQDYESWFYPESDVKSRSEVRRSYELIENKIVKSNWLHDLVEEDGFSSHKILLGLDLGVFYPRDVPVSDATTIIAMARPGTPRRGFNNLVRALSLIKSEFPATSIVLFGEDLSSRTIPFEYKGAGVVSSPDEMAELYSLATIFIDASDFQGFGRTALEAMACDTACILTNVGGLSEYARHDENCLLVPPDDSQAICSAFRSLENDTGLADRIRVNGLEVAKHFSHKIEARKTLEYFESIT